MKRILLQSVAVSLLLFISRYSNAQSVGINSTGSAPDASAMLDVSSTTSGMLIPRMTENQRTAIASPAIGLMVYQTDDTTGFYFYDGSLWNVVSKGIGWGLAGNSGTTPGTDFIGTTDANDVVFKTNSSENMRLANSTGNLVLGSGDGTGTVSGNTLRAPNASGTNIPGADITITSGDGTGSGGSGNLIFMTASAGSSGTASNTMVERMRISTAGAITFGGASNYGASGNVFQSGGNGAPAWNPITLSNTNSVTGTLAVANGGTGLTTFGGTNTLLYTASADNLSSIATSNNGVLITNGTGVPGIGTTLPAAVQGNITSVGTITSGTWNGTTIAVDNGGTGLTSAGVEGTVLTVVDGVPAWAAPATSGTVTSVSSGNLSPLFTTSVATSTSTPAISYSLTNAGAETIFGNNTGSSAVPAYFSPSLASALFADQGTTTTILHGNAGGNPSWSQVDLTADVTGTLPVTNGGTGLTTFGGTNTMLYTSAANTLSSIATANNGVLITSNTGVPSISSTLPIATQTNITELGTITTGTWNGTTIAVANGGTGLTSVGAEGTVLTVVDGVPAWAAPATSGTVTSVSSGNLSPLFTTSVATSTSTPAISYSLTNAGAETIFGNNTGSSAVPAYFSPSLASALFADQGTTTTILHGNAGGNPSWSQVDLTADVTGTLPVTNGGTGLTTFGGTNTMLYTSAANTLSSIATANNGVLITSNTGVPSISSTLPIATQTNITELGTITTGTWNGTTIAVANGGTGLTTFGGTNTLLYTSAANTLSDIATANNGVLITSAAGVPSISSTIPVATQTNITELGTITTGTWTGTTIAVAHGGTGLAAYTTGSLLDASAATTIGQINDVAAGSYLRSAGAGSVPAWSTLTLPNAATKGDIMYASGANAVGSLTDVAVGSVLLSGGVGAAPTYGKVALASAVSGTLPVANGGTGLATTPTNGQLLIGNAAGYTLATLTAGSGVSVTNASGSITLANTGVTSITGTANQVVASTSTGAVTLSLPQSIATSSSPTFTGLNLSGLSASSGVYTDGSENLTSTIPSSGTLGFWTLTGSDLSPSSTSDLLGIGTASPGAHLDIDNGHIKCEQTTAPTIAVTTQHGITAAAVSANSTDMAGNITTTGTNNAGGYTQLTITFKGETFSVAPFVQITSANSSGSTCYFYVTSGTTNFSIYFENGGATPSFNYQVIE